MWLDIGILVILLFSIVQGYRNGFIATCIGAVGWVLSIVLSFVFYPKVTEFLMDKTDFYTVVHQRLVDRFAADLAGNGGLQAAGSASDKLPEIVSNAIAKTLDSAASAAATSIADLVSSMMFNIIGFIVILLAIKLVLFLVSLLFSKRSNNGFIGFFDGTFGIVAGFIKGIILVFVILALFVPVTNMAGGDFITDSLADSKIAQSLYDDNILFLVIEKIW